MNNNEEKPGKLKLFIENFLIYGFGGIISKVISLIMVPIITRIMPSTEYFGISDLSNTLVSFGSAIATMGMYDAMYRMFFEKNNEDYKKDVCSTTLLFTCFMSFLVFLIMLLGKNLIAQYFFNDREYAYVVYLSAIAILVGATNSIIAAPTRMQNKRKIFIITNTISPILSYAISILLLYKKYYVIALPLAAVTSGVIMEITFGIMNKEWFDLKRFDSEILKQLLVIGIPLLPNFLIYWVFNSCDKVMITNIIGIGAAGIYSVSSKLGHASQLIYTAFAGGWQYFAFSTMREDDQVKSNSIIFEYLGIISFIATSFICAWSYLMFKVLFKVDYLNGYIIAPYLFMAPLLQMLFQVSANQFIVIKKTWLNMFVLSAGAILNIIINYFLIPILGIEGAAIATLIGYAVSDVVCVIVLCRMNLMVISKKFIVATLLMIIYMIGWRIEFSNRFVIGIIAAFLFSFVIIGIYKNEVIQLIRKADRKKV